MKENCQNYCQFCKFFQKMDKEVGECRINPPRVVFHKRPLSRHIHEITVFPKVKRNDWCGQHKEKIQ